MRGLHGFTGKKRLKWGLIEKYKIKVFIVQTMLPTHNDGLTPPLCSMLLPQDGQKKCEMAWKKYFWKRILKRWKQNLLYFGKSDRAIVTHKIKQQKIFVKFAPFRNKVFHLGFEHIPELILAPQAFDFDERKILPWQYYLGVMVDSDRQETIGNDYQTTIKILKSRYSKIAYCSLGTVNNQLDSQTAKHFFEKQINVFGNLLQSATGKV